MNLTNKDYQCNSIYICQRLATGLISKSIAAVHSLEIDKLAIDYCTQLALQFIKKQTFYIFNGYNQAPQLESVGANEQLPISKDLIFAHFDSTPEPIQATMYNALLEESKYSLEKGKYFLRKILFIPYQI